MGATLGIIGGGNMGQAIARGGLAARVLKPAEVVIAEIDADKRASLDAIGCVVTDDPRATTACDEVLLAVKPQQFASVAERIGLIEADLVVISIMAGIGTKTIAGRLGPAVRVVRAMPNTPCQLGEGMTGIALGHGARPGDERLARDLFEALGRTVMVDESLMDAVTAVSGSGPAYVYLLAELMQQAAVSIGLDEAAARLLVVQTIIGAGRMLRESGLEPAELRKIVTTPQGTTAAALDVMVDRDLPGLLVAALTAARDRGAEISRAASG